MLVTRSSIFTGKVTTLDLPVTSAQIIAYDRGALVQDAFPGLDADQREFMISGATPDEWAALFPPETTEEEI